MSKWEGLPSHVTKSRDLGKANHFIYSLAHFSPTF